MCCYVATILQLLMVVGASGQPGQSALLTVAVEHDVKLAHVPTLPQPMEERTALG